MMKVKRNNLTDQLYGFDQSETNSSPKTSSITINYDEIIERQAQIIESLYQQCTLLRKKINRIRSEELFSAESKSLPQKKLEKFTEMIEGALLKQIGTLLDIEQSEISLNKVVQVIKRIKWERQKKLEPIFIQIKKQVRIPVPVEVIVEKPVEKIIIQEKIVEIPVFSQKIVQKFISKMQQSQEFSKISSKQANNLNMSSNTIQSTKQKQQNIHKTSHTKQLGLQSGQKSDKEQKNILQENSSMMQCNKNQNFQSQFYSEKHQLSYEVLSKKMTTRDFIQERFNQSKAYERYDSGKDLYKSEGNKKSIKSPKYINNKTKNFNRENCKDSLHDYHEKHDFSYNRNQTFQDSYEQYQNQKTFYQNRPNNSKTLVSPVNDFGEKYGDEKYLFDKNNFAYSGKVQKGGQNLKKRANYNFRQGFRPK